ncbi:hydrogenase maturation factor HoxX-like [Branchiostoma floridae x Branchiostoma belcheri]
MIRIATLTSSAAWRPMMYLQRVTARVMTTSSQHGPTSQQPPRRGESQQPPRRGESQQPPRRRESQQPPRREASQQPPRRGESQQPPRREASQHALSSREPSGAIPWVEFAAPDPAKKAGKSQKITFLCNSFNGLSQRLYLELTSRGHHVTVHENPRGEEMTQAAEADQPDLVVCPFLTRRVPSSLYNNPARPVLIVHPGIPGDRGPSSIDWALKEGAPEWGVTVLQAADEMDAGDIWAACKFPVSRQGTKSSLYSKEVTKAAVLSVLGAIDALERGVPPTPLDYTHPEVKGELRRKLTAEDRQVDWAQPAEDVARTVRACDSQPGALGTLRLPGQGHHEQQEFSLFGACVEGDLDMVRRLKKVREGRVDPGDVIGRRNGAILVSSGGDTAVWISHLKASPKKTSLKLPATSVLPSADIPPLPISLSDPVPYGARPKTFQDIWTTCQDGVCYVHFDFYNGAMSTEQCRRLEQVLLGLDKDPECSVVALMGGYNFFSNGIHLNVIESSECAAAESWANITAIDDVVKAIFRLRNKVTVSVLQGNAGAGGVMMALAADRLVGHAGVVLNPHYAKMALFGSEYWTYSLPQRVGIPAAEELTTQLQPVLAPKARDMGLLDDVIGSDAAELNAQLHLKCLRLQSDARDILRTKRAATASLWFVLEKHRQEELERMQHCFQDQEYHARRRAFVYH